MSRGFIGQSPCYTPFSSQMSSAVGSIASFIGEQQRQNNLASISISRPDPTPNMSAYTSQINQINTDYKAFQERAGDLGKSPSLDLLSRPVSNPGFNK